MNSYRAGQNREAEALFKQAIEIDPEFASAHLMLAWTAYQQGQPTEVTSSAELAMTLRERATPAERAFIQGCYHNWHGELEEAWSHYALLFELEPDHPWGLFQLTVTAKRLGRLDRLAELIVQSAAAAPNLLAVQERGAFILVEVLGRLDLARPLIGRARTILEDSPSKWGDESGWRGAWICSFGIWERWLEGDVEAALSEAERVRHWLEGKRNQELSPQRHANFLGLQYLMLGRVKDARKLMRDFGAAPGLHLLEMTILSSMKLGDELRNRLEELSSDFKVTYAFKCLFVSPPDLDDGDAELTWTDPGVPLGLTTKSGFRLRQHLYLAGIALEEERFSDAIQELSQAQELTFVTGTPYVLSQSLIMLKLAQLYDGAGERSEAIKVLEELSSMRTQSYPATGTVWVFGQAHLADLYRQAGKVREADSIENELRALLKFADEDHPLRVKLTR